MSTFGRKIEIGFRDKRTGEPPFELDGENLNIGFTVERNLDLEPSTMLAAVHNLSHDSVELLKGTTEGWEVTLSAGYGDNVHVIFSGDVRYVRSRREPPLLVTEIEAGDGDTASQKQVSRHFGKGTTAGTVFKWLQETAGIGAGNIARITSITNDKGLPNRIKSGMTVRGYVLEEINDLARSRGAIFSIQNGEAVVLKPGEYLTGMQVTTISADTGLIGYPWVDNEGILTVNHRLLPSVVPGAPIDVESEFVNGRFVVERAVYSGSLYDSDFNIEIEGRAAL